jgi:hypothetical protein
MLHFTTFFDKNYLSRGLVLYDSIKAYCSDFELYILCLDEFTRNFFNVNAVNYPGVKTLALSDLEVTDPTLKACKSTRSTISYYFTLSPCLPLFLLKKYNLSHVCSMDADIFFLGDPAPLFNNLCHYSIVITPHKFSREIADRVKYGTYNVSFQIFKNDAVGIKCLKKWRNQCLDWCEDYMDEVGMRFADQKYLDEWLIEYDGKVKVLDDEVSGIAPWNLNNYKIQRKNGIFYSNGTPLIFYHFHSFKILDRFWVSNGFHDYKVNNQKAVSDLYFVYWKKIEEKQKSLNLSVDLSARRIINRNILLKILTENDVYGRFFDLFIFSFNFAGLYKFYKKVKNKTNGIPNRS